MLYPIVISIVFFLIVFLVCAIAVAISAPILERRARLTRDPATPDEEGTSIIREDVVSTISPWAALLKKFDFIHVIKLKTAEADLDWSVGRTCAMMLLCGTIALALLSGVPALPLLLVLGLTLIAAL